MIVSSLKEIIENFSKTDSQLTSLLIDGKYGCGKTHTVTSILNDIKVDYFYISLFGVDSLNILMSKLADKLSGNEIIIADGKLFFNDLPKEEEINGFIFVFDDLEKISDNVKHNVLYGVFDSLIKYGFKILCISNSEGIEKDDVYYELTEKIFDKTINVEADYRNLCDVVGDKKLEPNEKIIIDANQNWRIVKRAYKLLNEFKLYLNKNNISDFNDRAKTNDLSLLRSIVIAVVCITKRANCKPDIKDHYKKIVYETEVSKYGENETNNLYEIFSTENENKTLKKLTELFVLSINISDYSVIINEFYASGNSDTLLSSPPFNDLLFYYDDEGKKLYKEAFIKNIRHFDFSQRAHTNIAAAVLSYFALELSEEEKKTIIDRIVDTITNDELQTLYLQLSNEDPKTNEEINNIKTSISENFSRKNDKERQTKIQNAFQNKDYDFLIDFLYKNNYSNNKNSESILSFFAEYNFLLPDLSKKLSAIEWTYCHEIARYVARYESYVKRFIGALEEQCSRIKSRTLVERCNALIKYNFMNTLYYNYRIK